MTNSANSLYEYVLQQMAAEAYFEGVDLTNPTDVGQILVLGNNRENFEPLGITKFTDLQRDYFLASFKVVHQWSDNPTRTGARPSKEGDVGYLGLGGQQILANSGLSATLIQRKDQNGVLVPQYTLAIRSTEFNSESKGGDRGRDLVGADLRGIVSDGLALAQLAALEKYYAWLKSSNLLPAGAALTVTGYSLGGHLATVFTEMHAKDTDIVLTDAYTFNGAGRGTWDAGADNPGQIVDYYQKVVSIPAFSRLIASDELRSGDSTGAYSRAQSAVARGVPLNPLNIYVDPRNQWADYATRVHFGMNWIGLSDQGSGDLRNGVAAKITQLFGEEFPQSKTAVSNSGVHGPASGVFVEAQPFQQGWPKDLGGAGDFGSAHSIFLIADSLALMRAFQALDPGASIDFLGQLFSESSSRRISNTFAGAPAKAGAEDDALEVPLDALRRLFLGQGVAPTPYKAGGGGAGDLDARNGFYNNLGALQEDERFKSVIGKVTISLLPTSAKDMVAAARDDIAYRYALATLSTFAVVGQPELFDAYNHHGELEILNPSTGTGMLTEQFLSDRAAMLAAMIDANQRNSGYSSSMSAGQSLLFEDTRTVYGGNPAAVTALAFDAQTAELLARQFDALSNDERDSRMRELYEQREDEGKASRYRFGRDADATAVQAGPGTAAGGHDNLFGFDGADHLYGGDGNDSLLSGDGADYLQGDSGNDRLMGEGGDDRLVGGTGDDVLIGGAGTDKYYFYTGGGKDKVLDEAEGAAKLQLGEIYFGGEDGDIRLAGAFVPGDPDLRHFSFTGSDGKRYLALYEGNVAAATPGTLELRREGDDTNVVTLKSFISGDFGIVLSTDAPTRTYTDKLGTDGPDNALMRGVPHASSLSSDSPDQKVYGLAGSDYIVVATANAQAIGGDGNDYLTNGDEDQSLFGDGGRDVIVVTGGDDHLEGGADDDALQGGADADYLDGGTGNDVLDGGAGADVIAGGEGDDFIFGGGSVTVAITDWDAFAGGTLDWGAVDAEGDVLLRGLQGLSNVEGDEGDVITAGPGNDWVFAGDGLDAISGSEGSDYLVGQAGDDSLSGDEGDDRLYGDGAQGDLATGLGFFSVYTLPQAHGDDMLRGGDGNDFLSGDGGADELYGGAGDDALVGDSANVPEQYHGADTLEGGDGDDLLLGYGKGDTLFGGAGDDELGGDSGTIDASLHGDDYLDGEEGDDTLHGDGGSDELFGGAGNDVLDGDASNVAFEFHGDDTLDGEDGDDALQGGGGADTLFGGTGNDSLAGDGPGVPDEFAGEDYLDGEAGNDVLEGGAGDDTLVGGAGNDILRGQAGNDLYVVTAGDQQDFIQDAEGLNTIRFDSGGTFEGMGTFMTIGSDGKAYLEIRHTATDSVYVQDGLTSSAMQYEFADGSIRTAADWRARFDAFIDAFGSSVADTMTGSARAEAFYPGGGNDTIEFGPGSGFDRVIGFGQIAGDFQGTDTVRVGAGLSADDLDVRRDPIGNLILTIRETGDVLQIDAWAAFASRAHPGYEVVFDDGSGLTAADLVERALAATAANDFLAGGSGADVIDGGAGDDRLFGNNSANPVNGGADDNVLLGSEGNDQLTGGFGADVLDGGPGDDTMAGGAGADTFRWGLGDGTDAVTDASRDDIVELKSGLAPDDVTLTQGSIVVWANATGESLTLSGVPGEIRFADATTWDASLINEMANHATPFGDLLRGIETPDVLHGLGGDDTLQGFDGDDVLAGGDGNDTLTGDAGGDDIDGGAGNDSLDGGAQSDVLRGGPGDDTLAGGAGDGDVYLLAPGDGSDRILGGGAVVFDAAIRPEDVRVIGEDAWVLLDYGSGNVRLQLDFSKDWASHGIDLIRFADGTEWGRDDLASRLELDSPPPPDPSPPPEPPMPGDDILEGTAGDDLLEGGYGNDTYVFGYGSGNDTILEPSNTPTLSLNRATAGARDTIRFAPGVTPQDVSVEFINNRPVFRLAGSGESLTVASWSDAAAGRVEFAEFEDGTVWDLGRFDYWGLGTSDGPNVPYIVTGSGQHFGEGGSASLGIHDELFLGRSASDFVNDLWGHETLYGGAGNDSLAAGDGDDQLDGGAGNDSLSPGTGDNRIRFGRGFGQDTLNRSVDPEDLGVETVVFGQDVPPEQLRLRRGPNAGLILELAGTPDTLVINGPLRGAEERDRLRFEFADGTAWGPGEIEAHIQAVALIQGGSGSNVLTGGDGDDYFIGGEGDDTLIGGGGADTFYFERGDGNDSVNDRYPHILFGPGISPGDVALAGTNLSVAGGDLQLSISGNGGHLVVGGWFNTARIDGSIEFADGAVWDAATIGSRVPYAWTSGQSGFFFGTVGDDTYSAGSTDDALRGQEGDDTLSGNAGKDQLYGGDGDDALTGGAGDDTLDGEGGDDTLLGGVGNDRLTGGFGDDLLDAGVDAPGVSETDDDTVTGGAGNDTLIGRLGVDLLEGSLGDDVLDGGAGDDRLYGGIGSDTYLFGLGSGYDTLLDFDGAGVDTDTVILGEGIAPADLLVARLAGDLVLTVAESGDSLAVRSFGRPGYGIEFLTFADGTQWDAGELLSRASPGASRERADVVYGTAGSDTLSGLGGDDFIDGAEGDDVMDGGAGDDVLEGGAGNDDLYGGAGSDSLLGGDGQDVFLLDAASGSDSIADLGAGDVLHLGAGIAPGQVQILRDAAHLYLEIDATGQFIALEDWFAGGAAGTVAFEDGTQWDGGFLESAVDALTEGDDFFVATSAAENLASLGGLDTVYAGGGDDQVDGGAGSDALYGEAGNDLVVAGPGYDLVYGGEGDDTLEGGADDDALYGEAGDDQLDGGPGDDQLQGGLGGDAYRFGPGYGHDVIVDIDPDTSSIDTVLLDALPSNVSLAQVGQDLQLSLVGGEDRLTVQGWFNGSAMQVEAIRFLDASVWDAATVTLLTGGKPFADAPLPQAPLVESAVAPEAPAPAPDDIAVMPFAGVVAVLTEAGDFYRGSGGDDVLDALAGDDTVLGGPGGDALTGGEGDDYLSGDGGNDTLDGGAGRDILEGGEGNDRYRFGAGYGDDWVVDTGGIDEVLVDASLAAAQVVFTRDLANLILTAGADRLTLVDWFYRTDTRVETVRFADATSLDEAAIRLAIQVPAGSAAADTLFGSDRAETLLGLAGEDALYGEAGDDVLDGGTGTDYMLGGKGDDSYYVDNRLDRVTELPGEGADTVLASSSFALTEDVEDLVLTGALALSGTGNAGDNTIVGNAGANVIRGGAGNDLLRGGLGDDTYVYEHGDGSDVIGDVDATPGNSDQVRFGSGISSAEVRVSRAGDDVRLRLRSGGDVLLSNWFDPASRVESVLFADGTLWDAATIELLASQPSNEPPLLVRPVGDLDAVEDEAFVRALQPGTFEDPDAGDMLSYGATMTDGAALPQWLHLDAVDAAFAGTPGNGDVGAYAIRVTAVDAAGESAYDDFVLTVLNVNDAPELAAPIADQSTEVGAPFALTLGAGTFADADAGDRLALDATLADGSPLPGWLTFDAQAGAFAGTPGSADTGALDVAVTATDLAGAAASGQFRVTVIGAAPAGEHFVGTRHADLLIGTPYDDLIEGRGGDDRLLGGKGQDIYLFASGDGDDLIFESGGEDTLRFAAGVDRRDVGVARRQDDLMLRLGGRGGSVTIKGWFDSASRRVERVEFADGGAWDEKELRNRASRNVDGGGWNGGHGEDHDRQDHWRSGAPGHGDSRHRGTSRAGDFGIRDMRDAIAAWLSTPAHYDFSAVAEYLNRQGAPAPESMTPEQIAAQWRVVQHAAAHLGQPGEDALDWAQPIDMLRGSLAASGHAGWGYDSSTGRQAAVADMPSFAGLAEGFRKLE